MCVIQNPEVQYLVLTRRLFHKFWRPMQKYLRILVSNHFWDKILSTELKYFSEGKYFNEALAKYSVTMDNTEYDSEIVERFVFLARTIRCH